jgi:uncharacterized cupin superfamily protein
MVDEDILREASADAKPPCLTTVSNISSSFISVLEIFMTSSPRGSALASNRQRHFYHIDKSKCKISYIAIFGGSGAAKVRVQPTERAMTIAVLDPKSRNDWKEVELSEDETPAGTGPGKKSHIFQTPDGKVTLYFWTRKADIGILNGGGKVEGQKFDVILDGEAEVIDEEGVSHVARAGQVLTYSAMDSGKWVQKGAITKIAVLVKP